MDLLTAVLVICIHNTDGSSDCDIRVKKHIPRETPATCQAKVEDTGERIKQSVFAEDNGKNKVKEVRYRARCYTDSYASQVIANIPAWMENSNSSYTITYYD